MYIYSEDTPHAAEGLTEFPTAMLAIYTEYMLQISFHNASCGVMSCFDGSNRDRLFDWKSASFPDTAL